MFQQLRRAPLARGMPGPLVAGHALYRRLQRPSQLVQAGIHDPTLACGTLQADLNTSLAVPVANHTIITVGRSVALVKIGVRTAFLPCGFLYVVVTNGLMDGARVAPLKGGGGSEPRIPLGD